RTTLCDGPARAIDHESKGSINLLPQSIGHFEQAKLFQLLIAKWLRSRSAAAHRNAELGRPAKQDRTCQRYVKITPASKIERLAAIEAPPGHGAPAQERLRPVNPVRPESPLDRAPELGEFLRILESEWHEWFGQRCAGPQLRQPSLRLPEQVLLDP